jgi:hypothetical protein
MSSDNIDELKKGRSNRNGDQETAFRGSIPIDGTTVKKIRMRASDRSSFEDLLREAVTDGRMDQARFDWIMSVVEYS